MSITWNSSPALNDIQEEGGWNFRFDGYGWQRVPKVVGVISYDSSASYSSAAFDVQVNGASVGTITPSSGTPTDAQVLEFLPEGSFISRPTSSTGHSTRVINNNYYVVSTLSEDITSFDIVITATSTAVIPNNFTWIAYNPSSGASSHIGGQIVGTSIPPGKTAYEITGYLYASSYVISTYGFRHRERYVSADGVTAWRRWTKVAGRALNPISVQARGLFTSAGWTTSGMNFKIVTGQNNISTGGVNSLGARSEFYVRVASTTPPFENRLA